MIGRPERGRLVVRKLTDYTLGLYASHDYLARHGAPTSLIDLAEHRLVGYVEDLIYAPGLNYTRELWRGWRSVVEVSSAIGQVEAVRGGAGVTVLHDYLARSDPALVAVLPETFVTRSYWIAWHESLRDVARVQVTARFLVDIVQGDRAAFVRSQPRP